jgi:rhodanese-related sulfurtransferase
MFGLLKPKGVTLAPREVQALIARGEVTLVDVREDNEWRAGHIAGAIHVPLSRFVAEAGRIPTGKRVILYCLSGGRSGRALQLCAEHGLPIETHMGGGITAWRAAGL